MKNEGVPETPRVRASLVSAAICGAVGAGVEVGAEPDHVEPELARDQLGAGAIDPAAHRVQAIAHRPKRALRGGRERGLGRDRLVIVERQRAVHPPDLLGEQLVQRVERRLDAVAVPARVVAPHDDRHRGVHRAIGRRRAERHLVDGRRIEAQRPGVRRRARPEDEAENENDAERAAEDLTVDDCPHHGDPSSSASSAPASARPRGPVPVAISVRPVAAWASSSRR